VQAERRRKEGIGMIEVDQKSRVPIYEQIVEGISKHILYGVIPADGQLPSVRALAMQLAVNPNTVQKAYQALEDGGVIYSVPGKGSFASPKAKLSGILRAQLLRRLESLIRESAVLGMPRGDIQKIMDDVYRGRETEDGGRI
jgi:GntR family transcriptional regulator